MWSGVKNIKPRITKLKKIHVMQVPNLLQQPNRSNHAPDNYSFSSKNIKKHLKKQRLYVSVF